MGLLGAIGNGLAEAGGAVANIGLVQIKSAIEEERQSRLVELQSQTKLREDATTRERNQADAQTERDRVAKFSEPVTSQPNGLLSAGAGLSDTEPGADENVGRDVQTRERPASYKDGAERAAVAGDLKSAAVFEGLDNNDEKIKAAQVVAEMRQRYNTDRLTQQGQMVMMKLAASIAKGENGGKLPAEAQMMQFLVKEGIVPDMKAAAAWVKEGKRSDSDTEQVTIDGGGFVQQRVVTKKLPSGQKQAEPDAGDDPLNLRAKK